MNLAAAVSLAFVASITPGPNNLMLWASGMNHGMRASVRSVAGVNLGFSFLLFMVALGLGSAFERFSLLELVVKWVGGAYLAYLAYQVFTSASVDRPTEVAAPLTFLQAALFQWVNPKAWVLTTTAAGTLMDRSRPTVLSAAILTVTFGVVNLPCILAWTVTGAASSRWLENARRVRLANRALGILLALTVVALVA